MGKYLFKISKACPKHKDKPNEDCRDCVNRSERSFFESLDRLYEVSPHP